MTQPTEHTLTATPFETAPPGTFDPLLAKGWVIEGLFDMWDVADFIRKRRLEYPKMRLFAVLEDVGQAFYTSGHSLNRNDLDYYDPETDQGLSQPSDFPIRHKMFMNFVGRSKWDCWQGGMHWNDRTVLLAGQPVRPNFDDAAWVRDKRSYIMRLPVTQACDAIAAFPNGYFSDDLQPDQNYHLAKALEERFGLSIIGLGATYAGYSRDEPFTAEEAQALGTFLSPLYFNAPQDVVGKITEIAKGQHTLFLAYANR